METLNLPQRKEAGQRNKPQCGNPSKQHSSETTSKAGQVVGSRADLLTHRAAFKTELTHLSEVGTDQTAAVKG
jgi:hypothetical protein